MNARLSWIACVFFSLSLMVLGSAAAQEAAPALSGDLAELCAPDPQHPPSLWKISKKLDQGAWRPRLSCDSGAAPSSGPVLRLSVHPGDAVEKESDEKSTERVEIQMRKEVVKFDEPTWYRFRFRLERPWQGIGNRTVIHQVKQNIQARDEKPQGACPAANPLFKVEARPSATGADFLVKVRGTSDCNLGESRIICGPWHLDLDHWNDVKVMIKPSLKEGASQVQVWLNGRGCDPYTGLLGYPDHGVRDDSGRPFIDVQPRFGIYRDALPDNVQSIDFTGIRFWSANPAGDPSWSENPLPMR